jgi:hypothetical protein
MVGTTGPTPIQMASDLLCSKLRQAETSIQNEAGDFIQNENRKMEKYPRGHNDWERFACYDYRHEGLLHLERNPLPDQRRLGRTDASPLHSSEKTIPAVVSTTSAPLPTRGIAIRNRSSLRATLAEFDEVRFSSSRAADREQRDFASQDDRGQTGPVISSRMRMAFPILCAKEKWGTALPAEAPIGT